MDAKKAGVYIPQSKLLPMMMLALGAQTAGAKKPDEYVQEDMDALRCFQQFFTPECVIELINSLSYQQEVTRRLSQESNSLFDQIQALRAANQYMICGGQLSDLDRLTPGREISFTMHPDVPDAVEVMKQNIRVIGAASGKDFDIREQKMLVDCGDTWKPGSVLWVKVAA